MSRYKLGNFCVDEPRPMKVVVIGAGYSGMFFYAGFARQTNTEA